MQIIIRAPFAYLLLSAENNILLSIKFIQQNVALTDLPKYGILREAAVQLNNYFADAKFKFKLDYELRGSLFQQKVWHEISNIDCGTSKTYGEIAKNICSSPRPVGGACARNPLPIIVPCHRVLAQNGLGGFCHSKESNSYLLHIKRWLLQHEQSK